LAGKLQSGWLFIVFGAVLAYSAVEMLRGRHSSTDGDGHHDWFADKLNLHDKYYDPALGKEAAYRVRHTGLGLALMYVAGCVSGLLGIGSGSLKVPAMDLAMGLPIKVSTATSNFMIGVTAAASAGVYLARGDINPFIAAPVAAGVLIGAVGGSLLLGKLKSQTIRSVFVAVLLVISAQMLWKGIKGV
jgi:uncharacterized membrane protein YfcA